MTRTAADAPSPALTAVELPAPADRFLAHLVEQRRLSPHTARAYRHDLQELVLLHGPALLAVHAADVRRYVARLHGQGRAAVSLARTLSVWRSFYRWLGQRGEIAANPVTGIRAPRRPQRLPKALNVEQAVQLAAHVPEPTWLGVRDKAMVELLYSSGLRLAELASLDWRPGLDAPAPPGARARPSSSWIDLEQREATVLGKGRRMRSVPMGADACAALVAWLAVRATHAQPDEPALFVSVRGTRLTTRAIAERLARLGRRLGLGMRVHPHVLRHSMASHVLQSSGDLRAVQELLGHASIRTTQIYTRLDWQHLARTYDAAHPRARRKSST